MKDHRQNSSKQNGGRFFLKPAFQALTIGVPFCVFKLLFGLLAMRADEAAGPLTVFAWLVIVWALADLVMNLVRIAFHITGREAPIEYCTIAQAGRLFKRPGFFLAVDTLISFSIICFVLWSGWITLLSPNESYFWYAATTLNLISISVVNILIELRRGS
ncbi:MAG: hypothetical protein PHN98_01525 [Smithellaceae bacterium]|jgi:cation transport ATPase|nr:hypothetical protein [Smithellaceae bacterium]